MPATLRVPVAGWPKKRELGPLSSGQGKSMQFVDPDRIEQSDHVQAASFAEVCLITVIIYVSFEDILVSFSLHRLNCIRDHCTYVHGLAFS